MANYSEREGATGKKYTVYSDRIKVTYRDGSSRTVRPTDVSYQATKDAMEKDIADKKWYKSGKSTTIATNALGAGKTDGLVSAVGKPTVDTALQKENAILDRTKSMANLESKVQFNNNVAKANNAMAVAQQQIQNPVQPMTFAEKQRQASMQNLEYMVGKNQMQNDGGAKLNPIAKSVIPQITVNNVLNNMPSQLNNQPVSNMDVAKHTLESIVQGVKNSAIQTGQAIGQYSFQDADAYRMARTGNPALVNALSNPQQTDALAEEFAQDRIETAQQYADKMQEINEKYNADNFNTAQQTVGQIGSAVGQIAPAMLLGPAYLLPYMYGMSANQALGEGATIEQADDFAVLNTAKEFLIEMLVGGVPVGKMKSFIEPEKLMAKFNIDLGTANKVASRLFKALGEGGEEVLAGMAEPYLQRHTYDPDAENATLEELAWQFLIGAGAGGVFQGIDAANSRINNRNQRETQQIIQNMMQNAQNQQNLQAENAESLQKPQNASESPVVADVIKNITTPNKVAENQSSQADISQNVVENVLKQNQAEKQNEQPAISEKSSTVGEIQPVVEQTETIQADNFDINELPEETRTFYNDMSKKFGNIKLSRNLADNVPGVYKNGEVILNANKLDDVETITYATIHEFGHKMKGTAEYDQISNLALRYFRSIANDPDVTDMDLVDYIVGTREGSGFEITSETEAFDELTTMFMEFAFDDANTIDYICKEQPSFARSVVQFIEQKIRDYKAKKGMTKLEKQQYDMLSKARQLYVKGLKKSNQKDSADVETRFSVQADNRQKQFDVIQNSNPMLDGYHTGIRSVEDILTFEEAMREEIFTPDYTEEDAQNALQKGSITVYSSNPISQGSFVTPSKMEAQSYSADGNVYSKEVSLKDVAWIDSLEGQYAKAENVDSNGRELTPEQADYFKNSKMRDKNGNLMVMYHGSPNAGFTEFRSGTYFTPMKWYADGYKKQGASMLSYKKTADNPDTYEVYLNIEKPFDTRNPKERRIFEQEYYQQWGSGAPLADSGLPDWTDGMDLQEFIEEKGYDYDGLILDEGAVGGYGEEVKSRGLSYVVFNPEQVKNVDNQTPTKSVDIRYSTGGSASKRIEEIKNIKHGQKISKVYSNTMMNSPLFNEVEKTLELQEGDYAYDVKSEKESLQKARERLENDHAGTVKELMHKTMYTGEDVDAAMFLLEESIAKARETGNYSHAKAWVKKLADAGTEGGRTVQAFAKYSRTTAEGIATQAQRYVEQSEKALKTDKVFGKEVDSAKWRKVEAETEQAEKIIAEAEAQAQKSAEDKLSEMLAAKAESMVKGSSRKQELTDKQIVNELYNVLTETGIPDNRTKKKTDVYEYLRHAVNNKDRYTDVWEKAQQLLKEKYPADTEFDTFMRDSLDKFFKAGIIPTYSQKTTTAAMKQSAKELGIDLKQIIKENDGDKAKAMVQIADRVVKMTGFEKADADLLASEVISAYTKTLNEYTKQRLDQMFLSEPKPKNKKSAFDELMELINMGAYERQDIVDAIKQKNKLPVLTSKDIQTIQENVEKANQYKRYSYEWKMYMARAQQVASDKMPQASKDKITQFKRIMMLSGPRTHTRNIVGNVPLSGTEIISDVIGSMVDKGLSNARGTQRTTTANPFVMEFLRGFGSGAVDTVKDIRNNVNTYRMGDESVTQYEMPRGRTFDNSFLNGIDKAISYGLMFGDRTFFEGHYRRRMAQLNKLGYDTTSQEAKAEAYAYAVDMVFQSDSKMAEGARKFREALNSIFTVNGFALGDFVIPFVQTPANIADKLLDYSPVGFAKAMGQAMNSKTEAFDQRLFCQRIGRSLTGTAILGVSYALAAAGAITGGAPEDAEERNALYAAGWKPYSFCINGKYYDYSFIQPVGMLLAMGADAYRERQNAEDLNDLGAILFAGVKGGADCFFNMSFFSSLTDFFGGFGSTAENMASAFMDFPGQFAPAIVNAANKSIDPYQRETYDSDPIKRTINKFIAKTPASQTLPIKQDIYGRDMKQNQGRDVMKRTIENMLFPSTVSERKEDVLNDELLRLHEDTGKSAQFLSYPDKKQNLGDGNEFRLSGEEYVQFTKDANGYAAEQMAKCIASDSYDSLDDDTKVSVLNNIEKYATYNAKKKLAEAKGVDYSDSDFKQLEASGVEPYEYYLTKERFVGKDYSYSQIVEYSEHINKMNMTEEYFIEIKNATNQNVMKSDKDKNGKPIKGKERQDKVEAYIRNEVSSGRMDKQQAWYLWTSYYNGKDTIKACPYEWIREANKQ